MRPASLFPLFANVASLPGVGPQLAGPLAHLIGGERVVDCLWHLPSGIVERPRKPSIAAASEGGVVTLTVRVESHQAPRGPRRPHRVWVGDETGRIALTFFNAKASYLARVLPVGETRVISGSIQEYSGDLQMAHPDYIVREADRDLIPFVERLYPLTAGVRPRILAKIIDAALELAPDLPEWLSPDLVHRENWPSWRAATRSAHHPEAWGDVEPTHPARRRLAYDELLATQLALMLTRRNRARREGRAQVPRCELRAKVLKALPFTLTPSQESALDEIDRDMASPSRMLRLLQGDVGSGKTIVAFLAMLTVIENGRQAALMAPTDLLARQHAAMLKSFAEPIGVRVVLLTGRERRGALERTLSEARQGVAEVVVGTQAIFQEKVNFRDLGIVVIDEQHRFGVGQRLALAAKGAAPDLLVMTATPIPRTLVLAAYGDLDVSQIREKPAGRRPVVTRAAPIDRLDEVIAAVGRAIEGAARVYWVCPLVRASEASDDAAAEARASSLAAVFGDRVGLLHGGMSAAEKEATMAAFLDGRVRVLVATTVIEVGVDAPDASVMVIEHAERFGLAQLHQLRGRVGRSDRQSSCLLLYGTPLSDAARARLSILRESDDGFRIAEDDLRLRGPGEVLGVRQSGLPPFRLADLAVHGDLLAIARADAEAILSIDPTLSGPRSEALRLLLHLFERESAMQYVLSG